ncbi:hypothetical protein J4458_07265 [Candidatus Woesearchaeota archaeon]|nr:hypothetical protein [Candidatus Woesearchaeota archaeon]
MTSAFIKYEGNTPKNRILEFLVTFAVEDDYSMMDIAKHSKVSYAMLKIIWKEFVKEGRVVFTRNVGKAKMYKLNAQNSIIKKFIEYYWKIIEEETEEKPKADYYSTRAIGAVSARHF